MGANPCTLETGITFILDSERVPKETEMSRQAHWIADEFAERKPSVMEISGPGRTPFEIVPPLQDGKRGVALDRQANGIIGAEGGLRKVLTHAKLVAPTDSTVLIQGETGTGKEVIAQFIHDNSGRGGNFLQINCSAIPAGLLESELFGHEKGAYTGAFASKMGRFELANKGTLLLDEIGDLPLELQPKLLRVLQERELQRLGGVRTTRVDVRVIAATNQNLLKRVEEHEFRADLFYRLSIFPIEVPPLRWRRADIPFLVRHFTDHFAQRMHKEVSSISTAAMDALVAYDWPGNVRQLQNFIERAVILSRNGVLFVRPEELEPSPIRPESQSAFHEAERQIIVSALDRCGGTVGGRFGAAAVLGLPRTTLISKMKKLGIALPVRSMARTDDAWTPYSS
jgi:formate hydrogenlyase transcriptional activator